MMRKHHRAVVVILIVIAFSIPAFAQDPGKPSGFQVTSVSAGSGENAISSGLSGSIRFANEKDRTVEVAVQQAQAWVIYGPKFKFGRVSGYAGASVGHMDGSPWVGPYFDAEVLLGHIGNQKVAASTMHWPCFFPWDEPKGWVNDGKPKNQESIYLGYLMSYEFAVGPVGLTYARLNFLDDPWNTMYGVKYTQRILDGIRVVGSVTYNRNADKLMYFIGANWSRK